jgi:ATP phosphoribosyltransferase regulatory subunit
MVEIPIGLRDILPEEAGRLSVTKKKLQKIFELCGYREVNTPIFEYYDLLSSESSELIKREMFKLFDKDGRVLALRPEMTTPIARMVAQRMKDAAFPLRLSYVQNVFRDEPTQRGQQREFWQAGVELIGSSEPQADAEMIILLIESLLSVGLRDFQINIGQVDYIKACLDDESVDEKIKPMIADAILNGNFVELFNITGVIDDKIARDSIRAIPTLHGESVDEVRINKSETRKKAALDGLKTVVSLIEKQGYRDYVVADLGIVRNFNYYSGIIFEGYAGNLGFPICGGGRYDYLLGEFGYDQPATGFQIGIERLQIALENYPVKKEKTEKILVGFKNNASKMFEVSRILRLNDKICLNNFTPVDSERAVTPAKDQGCSKAILSDYSIDEYQVIDVTTQESKIFKLKEN